MKKPRIHLAGARRDQLENFYDKKHMQLANKVLLQIIEGMLRLEAIEDIVALSQEDTGQSCSSKKTFQFRLHEDRYPFLYQKYNNSGYGAKEQLFAAYIQIALDVWVREGMDATIKRYIKVANEPVVKKTHEETQENETSVADLKSELEMAYKGIG